MKYKVWVLAVGERTYSTNNLEFDTPEEATNYGDSLLSRWFGADKFAVLPVSDEFEGYLSPEVVKENRVIVLGLKK